MIKEIEDNNLQDLDMPITAAEFTADIDNYVMLPSVCFRINEMAANPRFSAIDMANEVAKDPMLMAQVLKVANSPYYQFPAKIDNLTRAISIIGTQDLQDMMLMLVVRSSLEKRQPELIDVDSYWKHSLFVGLMARKLGAIIATPILRRDRLFVAGVLHEFGRIIFAYKIPELFRVMLNRGLQRYEPFHEVETAVFGLDHTEIAAEVMHKWQYPQSLYNIIRHQHQPHLAGEQQMEAAILLLANHASAEAGLPGIGEDDEEKMYAKAIKITSLNESLMDEAMEQARKEYFDLLPVFSRAKTA